MFTFKSKKSMKLFVYFIFKISIKLRGFTLDKWSCQYKMNFVRSHKHCHKRISFCFDVQCFSYSSCIIPIWSTKFWKWYLFHKIKNFIKNKKLHGLSVHKSYASLEASGAMTFLEELRSFTLDKWNFRRIMQALP